MFRRAFAVSVRSINLTLRHKQSAFVKQNVFMLSGAPSSDFISHSSLAECVKQELKLEKMTTIPLPKVINFTSSLNGCLATLQRTYNKEKIVVNINANDPVEIEREANDENDENDLVEPLFMPTFSVAITKSSGDTLSFECSFDMFGDYVELGDEWDNLIIDALSVQSKGDISEEVYKIDPSFLSENFQKNILSYLEERGIDKQFTSEIVSFYREFEHHNYVNGFLEKCHKFLSNK